MVICGKWRRSARKDVAGEEGSSELVQRRTESWRVGNATMVSFRRVLLCGFSGCSQVEGKAMDGRWKREERCCASVHAEYCPALIDFRTDKQHTNRCVRKRFFD
ncbi:hypothetical protein HPP92_002362 [Vanilla planifolia]|uniref:Uncharacterized protein n=1 Tax=Vanilla planifolia TaxID=51239 RepID=A0A835S055_VANPL|nr:hypothetical protein HPP92_002362 [Vanilla planifolia]